MRRVFCLGVFDLLHIGHISFLTEAREFGDCLTVGLVEDAAIQSHKGQSRPIIPFEERERILDELRCVDKIIVLNDFIVPVHIIETYDVIVAGEDQTHIKNLQDIPHNKRVLIYRYPHQSTSAIIKKIQCS